MALTRRTYPPLSGQADVDREGDGWADLWLEGSDYTHVKMPDHIEFLEALKPDALRKSAATFAAGTGKGADNIAPVLLNDYPTRPCGPWRGYSMERSSPDAGRRP